MLLNVKRAAQQDVAKAMPHIKAALGLGSAFGAIGKGVRGLAKQLPGVGLGLGAAGLGAAAFGRNVETGGEPLSWQQQRINPFTYRGSEMISKPLTEMYKAPGRSFASLFGGWGAAPDKRLDTDAASTLSSHTSWDPEKGQFIQRANTATPVQLSPQLQQDMQQRDALDSRLRGLGLSRPEPGRAPLVGDPGDIQNRLDQARRLLRQHEQYRPSGFDLSN